MSKRGASPAPRRNGLATRGRFYFGLNGTASLKETATWKALPEDVGGGFTGPQATANVTARRFGWPRAKGVKAICHPSEADQKMTNFSDPFGFVGLQQSPPASCHQQHHTEQDHGGGHPLEG